jgi:anthranilate phosphoribosyltransferase
MMSMKDILFRLVNQEKLCYNEARETLVGIAKGEYNQSQVASFLTVFMLRPVTVEELAGFRDAMLELCVRIDLSDFDSIDLCGTGGDNKNTFNISTLSSFIVAGAGGKVTKHGNYGVSSSSGSSNMMEHFGYQFTNNEAVLKKQLDKAGICFLHAPLFHPAMKNVGPIRKDLGLKTFFNMLGPMVNPASPKKQLTGVFSLETARLYHYIYQKTDINYGIVYTLDGYDEISLTGDFKMISNSGEKLYSPEDLGFSKLIESDLFGGNSVEEAAKIFIDILDGRGTKEQINVVIANSGMALSLLYPEKPLGKCFEMAEKSLFDKKALAVLKNICN